MSNPVVLRVPRIAALTRANKPNSRTLLVFLCCWVHPLGWQAGCPQGKERRDKTIENPAPRVAYVCVCVCVCVLCGQAR